MKRHLLWKIVNNLCEAFYWAIASFSTDFQSKENFHRFKTSLDHLEVRAFHEVSKLGLILNWVIQKIQNAAYLALLSAIVVQRNKKE